MFRLGFLWLGSADDDQPSAGVDSLRAGMRERGYVEGRNLSIVVRDGHGRVDLLPGAAAALVALRVDVMITGGTAATLAAKEATTDIPIVFGGVADPVGRGVVASLSHPGANVTGLSRELGMDKAFDILREVAPGAQRVALVFHPANLPTPYIPVFMAARSAAAHPLGLTLMPQPVTSSGDIDAAFATMTANRVDAALIVNDTLLFENNARLLALARERHIATACLAANWAKAGCLFSYGEPPVDNYRRIAIMVDKILRGSRPADLPVEQGTQFQLVINLKTATALGLAIPASLLATADEVIE